MEVKLVTESKKVKQLDKLYGIDKNNKIKEWSICVENKGDRSILVYSYGYMNGKKTICTKEICKGKNLGKKNETTHFEQAVFEAESRWKKKKEEGCVTDVESLTLAPLQSLNLNVVPFPMLAHDYQKHSKKVETMLSKSKIMIQPKLDGYRMIYNTTTQKMTTRQGKDYLFVQESNELYSELKSLPKGLILDGELYTSKISFEELGVLRKTKQLNAKDKESLSKIQYHIYDVIDEKLTFQKRNEVIQDLFSNFKTNMKFIVYVPTFSINSEEELNRYHALFLEQGYEGTMIRNKDSLYKLKYRSPDLLKYKNFKDAEFKIVDYTFEHDTRSTGTSPDNLIVWVVETEPGKVKCKVRPQGTREERQDLYKKCQDNFDQFKGKKMWVKFFDFTADGSLRFPSSYRSTYTEYIRDEIL